MSASRAGSLTGCLGLRHHQKYAKDRGASQHSGRCSALPCLAQDRCGASSIPTGDGGDGLVPSGMGWDGKGWGGMG